MPAKAPGCLSFQLPVHRSPLCSCRCCAAAKTSGLHCPLAATIRPSPHVLQLSVLRLFEAILSDVSIKRAPDFQVRSVPAFFLAGGSMLQPMCAARASVCRWPAGGSAVLAAVVPRLNALARCPCRTRRPSAVQMMCASLPHRFLASLHCLCRTFCHSASRRSATCLHGEEQCCSDMTGCSLEPLHGCMCWRARQRRGLGTVLLSAPRLAWK